MIEVIDTENLLEESIKRAQASANDSNKAVYVYQICSGCFSLRFTPIPPESHEQGVLCALINPEEN